MHGPIIHICLSEIRLVEMNEINTSLDHTPIIARWGRTFFLFGKGGGEVADQLFVLILHFYETSVESCTHTHESEAGVHHKIDGSAASI